MKRSDTNLLMSDRSELLLVDLAYSQYLSLWLVFFAQLICSLYNAVNSVSSKKVSRIESTYRRETNREHVEQSNITARMALGKDRLCSNNEIISLMYTHTANMWYFIDTTTTEKKKDVRRFPIGQYF